MALIDELIEETQEIVESKWDSRDGEVIPESEDLGLGNECVDLEATFLYADLADSTKSAIYNKLIAAETIKAYLRGTTRIIRSLDGEIRSFDGDRVMGVFFGDYKNTNACKAALHINYFFRKILIPAFTNFYVKENILLAQTVGIDTSKVIATRTGIRNNNDLVWVGRAPNIAAKLSGVRQTDYSSFITERVFNSMNDSSKNSDGRCMWERCSWKDGSKYGINIVYRSGWTWEP